ncbi:MAG: proprotein convertase P-domain-containing protein [gamma proteobacterium symbiont of Lucinoma myriamae]|nr:proprotein convertase P-domain-containing protein [gamma proteobacterium symbiont of Lucinoma myriamae]MCU7833421.1 proprotein convertase P-domain-containing protein [gamma proteobacterium symbiont of Lucinoma myriamae]
MPLYNHINATTIEETGQSLYGCIIGTFRPEESLGGFKGEDSGGTWTLRVEDRIWITDGTLNSWSITLEQYSIQS